jgi:hypothetical protein
MPYKKCAKCELCNSFPELYNTTPILMSYLYYKELIVCCSSHAEPALPAGRRSRSICMIPESHIIIFL